MNNQDGQTYNFREMYDAATKTWDLTAYRAANKVKEKCEESYTTLCKMNLMAEKVCNEFIKEIDSLDIVMSKYLRLKAYNLLHKFREYYKKVAVWYYKTLFPIKKGNVSSRSELLKSDPFNKEFDKFSSLIANCQKNLDELRSKLKTLISAEWMVKNEFMRKRAEAIISDVLNPEQDPFGVFYSLYTTGTGILKFQRKDLESVECNGVKRVKGIIIKICNTKKGEEIPFAIISHFKKYNKGLTRKYGDIVVFEYDSDEFLQDLIRMLSSLINEVKIDLLEKRTFTNELGLSVEEQ